MAGDLPGHDRLCPGRLFHHPGGPSVMNCQCELIGEARAAGAAVEREHRAKLIEAERDRYLRSEPGTLKGNLSGAVFYTHAAQIVREQ